MQKLKESFSKYISKTLWGAHFYVFAIILHLLISLPLACILNIWMDEASTLYTTQNGFLNAFQNAIADEKQAPLYFELLNLWRDINHSVIFARMLSVIFSVIAIKIFFDLTRKFFGEKETKFITLFFALHPVLIWASLEIRVYSLVILLSILLLKFFSDGFIEESEEKGRQQKYRIFYILMAIAALYTNYYLGFILAGNFCALLALKRFRVATAYFWQMLIVGFCALPLLWIIKQQLAVNTEGFQAQLSLIEDLRILWGHALTFVLPVGISLELEPTIVSIIRVWIARIGILLLIFLLIKNRLRGINDTKIIFFGAVISTVCTFFLVAYFLVGSDYIQIRHAASLFVPFILLAATLFVRFVPRKMQFVFALISIFLFSYSLYHQYSPLAKRGDWIRVARFIEANERSNQPIIIFRNFDALSLPYHYHGVNKILPDKNFFVWNNEEDPKSENALKKQIDFIISQIPPEAAEIWLATEDICQAKETSASCQPLQSYIEANYNVLKTQDFYKERVFLLQKK